MVKAVIANKVFGPFRPPSALGNVTSQNSISRVIICRGYRKLQATTVTYLMFSGQCRIQTRSIIALVGACCAVGIVHVNEMTSETPQDKSEPSPCAPTPSCSLVLSKPFENIVEFLLHSCLQLSKSVLFNFSKNFGY